MPYSLRSPRTSNKQAMSIKRALLLSCLSLLLMQCDAEVTDKAESEVDVAPAIAESTDPLVASFRVRNREIRDDIIAELGKRGIPHKLNDDGSIGYRLADGEIIDTVYYFAVGLYAARN